MCEVCVCCKGLRGYGQLGLRVYTLLHNFYRIYYLYDHRCNNWTFNATVAIIACYVTT